MPELNQHFDRLPVATTVRKWASRLAGTMDAKSTGAMRRETPYSVSEFLLFAISLTQHHGYRDIWNHEHPCESRAVLRHLAAVAPPESQTQRTNKQMRMRNSGVRLFEAAING